MYIFDKNSRSRNYSGRVTKARARRISLFEIRQNYRKRSAPTWRLLRVSASLRAAVRKTCSLRRSLLSPRIPLIMRDRPIYRRIQARARTRTQTRVHTVASSSHTLENALPRKVRAETTIFRRPVPSRRQLAPGYSKIRYLRNYCINVGRASEIWHGARPSPYRPA